MKSFLLLIIAAITVSACGIKPGNVEPPDEVKNKEFPRTYPTIMTEPPPFSPPQK